VKKIVILVLGANGLLGHKLFSYLSSEEKYEVYGTLRKIDDVATYFDDNLLNRIFSGVDFSGNDSISHIITQIQPDFLINCIGIIKQSPTIKNIYDTIYINALLPHYLARICKPYGTRMIQISTDCVFSGHQGNYTEDSNPDATDLYGRTKLLGEVDYPHCLTLRTSIIGHELRNNLSLIEWLLSQKDSINGFTRHIFSGFPTVEFARILAEYIIPSFKISGVYHLSANRISKHRLLELVAQKYNKDITIKPCHEPYCDRSLNSNRLRKIIKYTPPTWSDLIDKMYQDYLENYAQEV